MSDEELQSLTKTYGNEQNDIKYLEFLNDANPYPNSNMDLTGTKTPYHGTFTNFSGES